MSQAPPWEEVPRAPLAYERPGIVVDLRRCIGCHACSVACKTEHQEPLGSFRMRVRWLPRPDRPGLAFLPLFDAERCDLGAGRARFGLRPACVEACPTHALAFGDLGDPADPAAELARRLEAAPLDAPRAKLHPAVRYVGSEPWQGAAVGQGVPLSPQDPDIIYEQRP